MSTIDELLHELPSSWQTEIHDYLSTVQNSAEDIFHEAGVPFSKNLLEDLLLIAAIKRIWTKLESRFWLLHNSLGLVKQSRLTGFRIGTDVQSTDSATFVNLMKLRDGFDEVLSEQKVKQYMKMGYAEILKLLREE